MDVSDCIQVLTSYCGVKGLGEVFSNLKARFSLIVTSQY